MHRDDSFLIALSIRGDRAAFGELVVRYQDPLYSIVFRLLGNADDALDVVQDAFLNAYQSLHHFKGQSRFYTWLYRIAVNLSISLKRRHRMLLNADELGSGGSLADLIDDSAPNEPSAALERQEDEQRLQAALNRLTVEHRAVLVLKELDGLKYEEIAVILRVPVGTIRSRLHRARLELRDQLRQDDES